MPKDVKRAVEHEKEPGWDKNEAERFGRTGFTKVFRPDELRDIDDQRRDLRRRLHSKE